MIGKLGRGVHLEVTPKPEQPDRQSVQCVRNVSWIRTRVEGVSPEEVQLRLGDPVFTQAMRYVQEADSVGPASITRPATSAP